MKQIKNNNLILRIFNKKCFAKIAFLFAIFVCTVNFTYGAKSPGYGYYDYNYGASELILPYDLALDLANNLNSNPNDVVTQNLIRKLVERSYAWGGRVVPWAAATSTVVNLALSASRLQMKLAVSVKNYEAYGFKQQWGVPYSVKSYSYDDYTLLRERSSPTVYVVIGDARFGVPDGAYFNYEWNRVKVVDDGRLSGWFKYPNKGTLIKEVSNPTVWVIDFSLVDPRYTWIPYVNYTNWVRRGIPTYDVIQRMGKTWSDVRVVPDGALTREYIPIGYPRTY